LLQISSATFAPNIIKIGQHSDLVIVKTKSVNFFETQ